MNIRTQKLLILAILALVLAACGQAPPTASNTAPTTNPSDPPIQESSAPSTAPTESAASPAPAESAASTPSASAATAATPGEVTEISVSLNPSAPEGASPPADWEGYKVLRDQLGIDLNFTMIPSGPDGITKLSAQAAANDLPDLMQFSDRSQFFKFVDQGLLAPVADLLPQMTERTKLRYSDENLNRLVTVDGTLYGLQEPAQLYKREGLVIRQDWLDKLGLEAPKTLDEFMAVAKAFTEQDPDGNGQNDTFGFGAWLNTNAQNNGLGLQFNPIYGAYELSGTWHFTNPDNFGLSVKDPQYQQATTFIKQLNDAKVIDPDWPTIKQDDFRSRWKQGKYGMFVEDFCALICKANYQDFDANNPSGELRIIPPPTGPNGQSAVGTFAPIGNLYAVSQNALDAGKGPAIAKFLEWANNGEGYYLLGFGKEGVNYKLDDKNNIVTDGIDPTVVYTAKEQQPVLQLKFLAYAGTEQELRARYVIHETSNGRTIDPLDYYKATFNSPYIDATASPLIQPAPNQADIDRYISENLVQFVLGQKPLTDATWQEFIAGLEGLGVSEWEANAKQTLQESGFLK